ncbi:MAG: adenosylcobinamide-phosphate synthase CbiB [bacterium]
MYFLKIPLCYLFDIVFGTPEWLFHPTRTIGKLIKVLEKRLRGNSGALREKIKGGILVFIVVGVSAVVTFFLLYIANKLNRVFYEILWVYLGYTTLAIKDLRVKGEDILKALKKENLRLARKNLSKIVSRDTKDLEKEGIIKSCIESIAENINDGIIAPLFYLFLGGPILAMTYKAINTLDSMLGYKNERYLHFGFAAARLDDLFNFIPARISGFLICLSGFNLRSFRIMLRDGKNHPSPNAGISKASIAGVLGIRLGGKVSYDGKEEIRPYIGEEINEIEQGLINKALNISFICSFLMLCLGLFFKWLI